MSDTSDLHADPGDEAAGQTAAQRVRAALLDERALDGEPGPWPESPPVRRSTRPTHKAKLEQEGTP